MLEQKSPTDAQIYLHNAKEILRFISILWDVVMGSAFAVWLTQVFET